MKRSGMSPPKNIPQDRDGSITEPPNAPKVPVGNSSNLRVRLSAFREIETPDRESNASVISTLRFMTGRGYQDKMG